MQSKTQSWIETIVGTAIGFIVAWVTMAIMYRILDIPVRHAENTLMVTVMTVLSILRVYGVRRLFNWWHHRRQPSVEDVTRKLIESVAVATGLTYEELTRVPDYSKGDLGFQSKYYVPKDHPVNVELNRHMRHLDQLAALERANTNHLRDVYRTCPFFKIDSEGNLEKLNINGSYEWINTVDKQP